MQSVQVVTNSFPITTLPQVPYTQYDIAFAPDFKGKAFKKKRDYVGHLQTTVAPNFFPKQFLYDGGAVGYAHKDIERNLGSGKDFYVDLRSERLFDPSEWKAERSPCVKISFRKTIGIVIHSQDINPITSTGLTGHQTIPPERRSTVTNFLQLLVRQATNNKYPNTNKAYFMGKARSDGTVVDPKDRGGGSGPGRHHGGDGGAGGSHGGHHGGGPGRPSSNDMIQILRNGLEIRRGIFHSVRPAPERMVVTIDTVATAFYCGGNLVDKVSGFLNMNVGRLNAKDPNFHKMVKYFKGLRIQIHIPVRARETTKTIRGFISDVGGYSFDYEGQSRTIEQHYLLAHNHHLQYPKGPGVILQDRPIKVIVPMEVCTLLPDQIFRKTLPPEVVSDMVKFASISPASRYTKICDAAKIYTSSEPIHHSGMVISTTPLTVPGNWYSPPVLQFANSSRVQPSDGKWNIVRQKFYQPAALPHFAILNCAPGNIEFRQVDSFIGELIKCGRSLGMEMGKPHAVESWNENIEQSLRIVMSKCSQSVGDINKHLSNFVLFVILPQDGGIIRTKVKHWGDIRYGVKTQCLRVDKLKPRSPSALNQYCNNVALKVNARLGGTNSILSSSPTMQHLMNKTRTVIMGADVGHPGPGVTNKPSVTSVVFSLDRAGTKYAAITSVQKPREETITNLAEMVKCALNQFANAAMGAPNNIIFFRDGVSEGEYSTVEEKEIEAIGAAIKAFQHENRGKVVPVPKLTFIVVGKRHHTLLFPQPGSNLDDRKGNCRAGVAVDRGITDPSIPNFYLQSHAAIQGTSRSSHYIVLRNEVFVGSDAINQLQEFAFALCHVYAKATRSVSIPAPVYYADLACARGAFHVNEDQQVLRFEDSTSIASTESETFQLEAWQRVFRRVHQTMRLTMYFL